MTDSPRTKEFRRSIRDRMRIDTYLTRLEWHLEGILSGADRKATIKSLRQELMTDPRQLTNVLSDLGPPNVLATRYAEEGERRPFVVNRHHHWGNRPSCVLDCVPLIRRRDARGC